MIISHKHKFIFIKTNKTAGTSIEVALSQYCGPKDIITPISDEDEEYRKRVSGIGAQNYRIPIGRLPKKELLEFLIKGKRREFFNHMGAREILKYIPREIWDSYYKFSFERNPWDKVVSLYDFLHGNRKNAPTLSDFIERGRAVKLVNRGFELYSIENRIVVDRVFFYEDLENELKELARILGIPELKVPEKKLKGRYREKKDYREVLSKEDKERIEKLFAREIAYFGYRF